ncbi:MAG: Crp/Fnr family transcriptional regulator [Planctomycetales bacterium]
MDEKFWYLKRCDLFERLTSEQTAALERRSRSRTFDRGDLIYLPSDRNESVLLLTSGRVKIYHLTAEGKQAVLALVEPGEIFGELAVFGEGRREEFAETMEKSTLVLIPGEAVRELMEQHPLVSMQVTRLMGLRRQQVERRLKSLLFRSNRERLAFLLLELAEKYGQPSSQSILIGIRLSHQELANIIGSTRETVTVLLGELQAEGLIAVSRRQIILREPVRLAAIVGVDLPRIGEPHLVPRAVSHAPPRA